MNKYWNGPVASNGGVFVTCGLTPFNIATLLATGAGWSHMGEIYLLNRPVECEGEMTDHVVFEMSFKHGYIGPRPMAKVARWAAKRGYNRFDQLWLPKISGLIAEQKYHEALKDAGKGPEWDGKSKPHGVTAYARFQLLLQFAHERWGIGVPDSAKHTTCSEMTSRRVFPEYDMRGDDGHGEKESHDAVSPGSGWARIKAQVQATATA